MTKLESPFPYYRSFDAKLSALFSDVFALLFPSKFRIINRNKSIFARCFALAFEWISNEPISSIPYISLDSQDRLYLSVGAVKQLGINLPAPMMIGYDKVNKRLIMAKPDIVRAVNTKPFKFGEDRYAHARAVVDRIAADGFTERPLRFIYVGKDFTDEDYPDGSFAFQLVGFNAPDGGIYETLGSRRFRRSGAVKEKAVKKD